MSHRYDDEVLYRTVELFLEQDRKTLTVKMIAEQVNQELRPKLPLTREAVYKAIAQAKANGIVRLVSPPNKELAKELSKRFESLHGAIDVVNTAGPWDNAKVAEVAADRVLDMVRAIGLSKRSNIVGIGLGPGRASLDFCRSFCEKIKSEARFPKLRLVAISSGCPARLPEYASTSFFNLFPSELVEEKIGLFAESLVRTKDLESLKRSPGVHEAFEAKAAGLIDVVVTSMGDFGDKHDLLRMFLTDAGMTSKNIQKRKWVGNVQYRPYTKAGPVEEQGSAFRAVTLFELEDLVKMAGTFNKRVVLIARQCGICQMSRAAALLPLITNQNLKVFSHLIVDATTAKSLLYARK